MKLVLEAPPHKVVAVAHKTMAMVGIPGGSQASERVRRSSVGGLFLAGAHRLYLAHVLSSPATFRKSLALTYWRFLIVTETNTVGTVDVPATVSALNVDHPHAIGRISVGTYAAAFNGALHRLDGVLSDDTAYVVSGIEINVAHAHLLWLRSDEGEKCCLLDDSIERGWELYAFEEMLPVVQKRVSRGNGSSERVRRNDIDTN